MFRIDPQGQVHLATDACEYPNGLAFSPDESILYVAISRLDERCFQEEARGDVCTHRRIRAFDVAPDGTLRNNRVFCEMASAAPASRTASKSIRRGGCGASAPAASGSSRPLGRSLVLSRRQKWCATWPLAGQIFVLCI